MRYALCMGTIAIALAVMIGCEKEQAKPTAPTPPAPAAQNQPAPPADMMKAPMDMAKPATQPGGMAAAQKEADVLIQQVKTHMQDKKWDDADAALKKLEALKPQLPADYQQQIETLRKSVDAAKAVGGMKLPG